MAKGATSDWVSPFQEAFLKKTLYNSYLHLIRNTMSKGKLGDDF